jgi:hypothetical protein
MRSPREAAWRESAKKASAWARVREAMKETEAPAATQSMRTSARAERWSGMSSALRARIWMEGGDAECVSEVMRQAYNFGLAERRLSVVSYQLSVDGCRVDAERESISDGLRL